MASIFNGAPYCLAISNWQKPLSRRFSQISADGNLAANEREIRESFLFPAIMKFMAVFTLPVQAYSLPVPLLTLFSLYLRLSA
ncbi:MAG TPA: hypothetical protein VGK36_02000 [Candidatus Angelobacter sp.]|jgi:hypothetical protein